MEVCRAIFLINLILLSLAQNDKVIHVHVDPGELSKQIRGRDPKSVHLKKFQEIAVTKASTPKPSNVEPNVIAQIFIPKGQKPKGD